ncbi:MAG: metallophosphoesterase family protein [Vicinamibacterales bacterium]
MLIGLVSDTHGLLRPEALDALRGVDLIFHAGDVGGYAVLSGLEAIAPTRAVYGNVDAPGPSLAAAIDCDLEGSRLHVSHGHEIGSPTPARLAARYTADVIVFGHTHLALIAHIGPALVINPGAAGPARFKLNPSIALLTLPERDARIVWL